MKNLLCLLLLLPSFLRAQTIHIVAAADTICTGSPVHFTATPAGISSPHYKWQVNSSATGSDSSDFTTATINNGDSVKCLLTNATGDTIFAVSNRIAITVETMPFVTSIIGTDTNVCVGATISFSNATPGGIWSFSNYKASVSAGIVTGRSPSNWSWELDSLYYTITNSCGSDTASKTIKIHSLPDATFYITGTLCVGGRILISSGWSDYPGFVYSLHGKAAYVDNYLYGTYAGTDSLVGVSTTYCGTDTLRRPITIYGLPTPGVILGHKDNICAGDTIQLVDTGFTGGTLQWSASNGNAVVKSNSGVVTGVKAGLDTIYCRVSGQCGYKTTSTTVSVAPPYAIKYKGPVCKDRSVPLYDSSMGGVWTNANHLISSINSTSGIVTGISTGIDTITYSLPNGCSAKTTITVNPLPAPVSGDDLLCIGEQVTLADTGNSTWLSHDSDVIKIRSYYHTVLALAKGTGIIHYSLNTGCYDSFIVRVFDCNTYVSIFPNPTRADIIVQVDTIQFNHLSISTLSGQVLLRHPITDTFTKVSVQSLPPGMYIICLYGGHGMYYYAKLVKD